jgi:hypothetical protein
MTDFDLTSAIADFLADASRATLELPHMTTGQRKKTKMLLDGYPDLRCESFGFGAERQLHLFKKETDSVSVQKEGPFASVENDHSKLKSCSDVNQRAESPACSTHVSTDTSDVSYSRNASPQSVCRDRESESVQTVSFINVRNTFINWETTSIDERTVQSMPHGMFGTCMLAEMSQKYPVADKPIIEEKMQINDVVLESLGFSVGDLVIVEGLVKAPMFNGLTAVVQGWDDASHRYRILIGSAGGSQQAMVKEENLKQVLPCP